MRTILAAAAVAALGAGAAQAQELKIEDAAARLVVIPEARRDVQVTVTPGAARLPVLQVRRQGGDVEVNGDLERRIDGCDGNTVRIRGVGRVPIASLPVITARVPLDAEIGVNGAVYGSIGRTNSLDLAMAACGELRAGNVAGELEVASAGSGTVFVGASREAEVSLAGSGDVRLGLVANSLQASIAGAGDVHAASVSGPVEASIAGAGDVIVGGGRTGPVSASIVGAGDVRIAGTAASVNASILGVGDVRVGQVTGPVRRSVLGAGDVIIGR